MRKTSRVAFLGHKSAHISDLFMLVPSRTDIEADAFAIEILANTHKNPNSLYVSAMRHRSKSICRYY